MKFEAWIAQRPGTRVLCGGSSPVLEGLCARGNSAPMLRSYKRQRCGRACTKFSAWDVDCWIGDPFWRISIRYRQTVVKEHNGKNARCSLWSNRQRFQCQLCDNMRLHVHGNNACFSARRGLEAENALSSSPEVNTVVRKCVWH